MKKSTNYFDLFFKTPVLIGFEPYASHEAFFEAHEEITRITDKSRLNFSFISKSC